jgi:hypothetical protein
VLMHTLGVVLKSSGRAHCTLQISTPTIRASIADANLYIVAGSGSLSKSKASSTGAYDCSCSCQRKSVPSEHLHSSGSSIVSTVQSASTPESPMHILHVRGGHLQRVPAMRWRNIRLHGARQPATSLSRRLLRRQGTHSV